MGKRYLRTIVQDTTTLTASTAITPVDLPVNPLSHLVLTINAEIAGTQAALNTFRRVTPFLAAIDSLSIRHRGENIIDGNLQDLAVMAALLCKAAPHGREYSGADNTFRSMSFILPFGRSLYDPAEAFPATQRGNLRFHMTAAAAPSGFDNMQWALEAIELIEDTPTRFLKYTTLTRALAATGRQRIPLPIGNDILGILLFDPTDESDATETYAFGKAKILKDNVEQYIAQANWEALAADLNTRHPAFGNVWGHRHEQAAADTSTGEDLHLVADLPPLQYGYLDFDPRRDGYYSMETAGASSLDLDMDSDVSTGTVRVIPVEWVKVPGAGAAA